MEKGKTKINLGPIQETLLLPLWARAKETEKEKPIIRDLNARDIISSIDYDFSKIEAEPEIANNQQLMWAIRAFNFDAIVSKFLNQYEKVIVINIGAGLDTTFQRVDNGSVLWINIDLPDVAALRIKLIPNSTREITIGKSIFDFSWIDDILHLTKQSTILFIAAGVLFYFDRIEVKTLFNKLNSAYPKAHFVFDAISSKSWVTLTNWAIMRKSGLRSEVRLRWYLNKASKLSNWIDNIKVIDEYSMFSRIPLMEGLSKKLNRDLMIAKHINIYNIFHIQF
jgi:O-methyltransferase involved in polyketide biosynthesis